MRRINEAYHTILEQLTMSLPGTSQSPSHAVDRRFSQEEIDAIVRALPSEGPLDWIGWVGSTLEGLVSVIIGTGFVVRVVLLLWRRDFAGLLRSPEIMLWLVILALLSVFRSLGPGLFRRFPPLAPVA
jgi:hypothetical protein